MQYYLIKYEDNWADEMDVEGHIVLTQKEYEAFGKNLEEKEEFTFVIGSNQDIEYENMTELEYRIDIDEISQAEYDVFKKYGMLQSGFAPSLIRQLSW